MKIQKPERKDWVLLIFIIPIAALLLLFVGQWAIRLLPFWSVNAGMNSNLEPDSGAAYPFALLEPLLPQILIPLPWAETYLDPEGDFSFPPFLTFEPTASPSPTTVQPTQTEATPTATATPTETPTVTSVVTSPTDSGGDGEETPTGTTVSPSPSPTTPSPSPTTPTPVCPGAHNPDGPLPCDYGNVSTPPVGVTQDPSPDSNIGENASPDGNIGFVGDGSYIVLSLSVTVNSTPDNFYDLVFYEWDNSGFVYMDLIIIGITNDGTGSSYYEVFNWGNGLPDMNSNVGDVAIANGGEDGDQPIPIAGNTEVPPSETELYDPDYDSANGTNGTLPQTGILIDVDNADSNPPPGTYNYIIIISPPEPPGGSDNGTQLDSIQITEVPISPPPPLPAPLSETSGENQKDITQPTEEPLPTEEPVPIP